VWISYILLVIAIAGTLSSCVFLVLAMLGAAKFHRDARRQLRASETVATRLPPVSLLKPVHGREARLGQRPVWRSIPYELVGEGRIAMRRDLLESEVQE
jgi:hypothetical protein